MTRKPGKSSEPEGGPPGPPPETGGKKKSGSSRPDNMTGVNLYSDVAQWAKELAEERGVKIGVYLDDRLRGWLWKEYQAMTRRKADQAAGKDPPPPPGQSPE